MRDIKFRAWDGEQMVSPDYVDREGVAWWRANSIPTRSKNVMQYTGLKDKNGVEIYEDDILKDEGVVFYRDGAFQVYNYPMMNFFIEGMEDNRSKLEVLGNIHENPELLKESLDETKS